MFHLDNLSRSRNRSQIQLLAFLFVLASAAHADGQLNISPIQIPAFTPDTASPFHPESDAPAVMFGVGDIGQCALIEGARQTGALMQRLLDETPHSIGVSFGDNNNDDGSKEGYDCLDQTAWGGLAGRLYPTPGNHDYGVDRVLPYYFLYFPNAKGPENLGYYSYDFGGWHVLALNSELDTPELRQQQLDWIDRDLKQSPAECTMAYFHRPPFSSGKFASPAWTLPIFRQLYRLGIDLVGTGHEHFFASLPPLNPDGESDEKFGIPILTVGTGGAVMFPNPPRRLYHEMILTKVLGVVKITLRPGGYNWAFIATDGTVPRVAGDKEVSGSGTCHGKPPMP